VPPDPAGPDFPAGETFQASDLHGGTPDRPHPHRHRPGLDAGIAECSVRKGLADSSPGNSKVAGPGHQGASLVLRIRFRRTLESLSRGKSGPAGSGAQSRHPLRPPRTKSHPQSPRPAKMRESAWRYPPSVTKKIGGCFHFYNNKLNEKAAQDVTCGVGFASIRAESPPKCG